MLITTPPHGPSRGRSLAKTVTWRVLATTDTFLIGWLVTGSVEFAGSIASLEVITKMALYYVHERFWAHTSFGRAPS